MHILGGVVVGSLGLWFFASLQERHRNFSNLTLVVLLFTLLGGLLWEIQEYLSGNTFNTIGSYPLDTVKDLVMDVVGAVIVLKLFYRHQRHQSVQTGTT